jgi:hypothetical protein
MTYLNQALWPGGNLWRSRFQSPTKLGLLAIVKKKNVMTYDTVTLYTI